MDKTYVLDSFAVLALLGGEPGSDKVARLMAGAVRGDCQLVMSWVNVGEVAYIVERRWGSDRLAQVLTALESTAVQFVVVGWGFRDHGRNADTQGCEQKSVGSQARSDRHVSASREGNRRRAAGRSENRHLRRDSPNRADAILAANAPPE